MATTGRGGDAPVARRQGDPRDHRSAEPDGAAMTARIELADARSDPCIRQMTALGTPCRITRAQRVSFLGALTADEFLARLAAMRYRGVIVGPEGSVKSPLLGELQTALSVGGFGTRLQR